MTLPNRPRRPQPKYDPNAATRAMPPRPVAPNPSPGTPSYPPAYPSQYKNLRNQRRAQRRRQNLGMGCGLGLGVLVLLLLVAGIFVVLSMFVAPLRANILVIGIDRVPEGTVAGRSDTNILLRVDSSAPRIATLAVPRDLWVEIPGYGENRINTAHFFAEAAQPGSGPAAAMQTFSQNFNLPIQYYLRLRLEGIPALIDAMGGITLNLSEEMAGYAPGQHHLNGTQALAFVRDRKGTDDFFRMAHGQVFVKAAAQQLLNPLTWLRLPLMVAAFQKTVDSNLSFWQMANAAITVLRVGPEKIESNVLPREDTTPANINGAQVLLPVWPRIHPFVQQIFQ